MSLSEIPRWGDLDHGQTTDTPDPLNSRSIFPVNEELNSKISLWLGGVWLVEADAIVNPCEEFYTDKRGFISENIHRHAGPVLEQELVQLAIESSPNSNPMGCRTGEAVITNGYSLPARKIIHTVGPRYNEKYASAAENMLHSCYRSCLQKMIESSCRTIAFASIHSERKLYLPAAGIPIALRTLRRLMERWNDKIDRVIITVLNSTEFDLYTEQMKLYFPRSAAEEAVAARELPHENVNDYGETTDPERRIRIVSAMQTRSLLATSHMPVAKFSRSARLLSSADNSSESVVPAAPVFSRLIALDVTLADCDDFTQMQPDPDSLHVAGRDLSEEGQEILYQRYLKRALRERLSDLESQRILYRCGSDLQGRPTLVVAAAKIPSVHVYDRLFLQFIKTMDAVAEHDYAVVYLHAGLNERPEFAWLHRAYTLLPKKYKKNLKAVYVVHPTLWFQLATAFLRPFVATQFWQKVYHISRLAELYTHIKADQLTLPDEVKRYDAQLAGGTVSPEQPVARVVGSL